MSDCPDCDNTGLAEDGNGDPFPCPGWRHRVRPTLAEIAQALRDGREPPRTHSVAAQPAKALG